MNRLLIFLILSTTSLFAQLAGYETDKQVYLSEEIKTKISTHKLIAILPFKVIIEDNKEFNRSTNTEIKQKEIVLSKSLQSSLAIYLLAKKSNYTVNFLDVEKTNILLKRNGMLDKLEDYTKDEVAKLLQVDAIISGEFYQEKQTNDIIAITKEIIIQGDMNLGKTGTGNLTLSLNNGLDGELLWKFTKTMNEDFISKTDVLINRMMRKVSRNFPYKK